METPAADLGTGTRRDRSVARVLDPARQRAEERVQRFLDAAVVLLRERGGEFTLQEVVERAGLSLRSFYQHFGGKHELLLTLFEDAVRRNEQQVRERLEGVVDPLERLHRTVVEYYVVLQPPPPEAEENRIPRFTQFGQALLTEHPQEASTAFAPVVALFEEVLLAAAEAGVVREVSRPRRLAAFLLQTVNFNAYVAATVVTGRPRRDREAAEELWDLLFHGLEPA